MLHLITELSKYVMIILFVIYTYYSYSVLVVKNELTASRMYKNQTTAMMFIHLDAFLVIFANTLDLKILIFYGAQLAFVLVLYLIYRKIYKRAARMVVNHMCMMMLIGFIILSRLKLEYAVKQFEIAVLATVVTAFIPQLIRKFKYLKKFTWVYCAIGILALGAVLGLGAVSGGAHLSFTIAGITLQPSEFIKIVFVFFVACMLHEVHSFRQIVITTIAAALHVLILVLSTDLGAALIFFVTYVIMLYVATRNIGYFAAGMGVGALAAVVANKLFSHVRVRVSAWKDPFASINGGGYQIAQSLFAIGTGSWFGLGLYQGMPEKIPVGSTDFVFASISEEMGGIFGICIILVCFSCVVMFMNIALQIKDMFYKLIALGLGCVYGIQVFLNIGGVIKCIPSTGVTLPLISYGGSSILCTIVMFAIIQGLYIMRQDEGGLNEQTGSGEQASKTPQRQRDHRSDQSGSERKRNEKKKTKSQPKPQPKQTPRPESKPHGRRPRPDRETEIEEIW